MQADLLANLVYVSLAIEGAFIRNGESF